MTHENDEADSLFVGPDPAENKADDAIEADEADEPDQDSEFLSESELHKFAEQEEADAAAALGEKLYADGPNSPAVKKSRRGRPTLEEVKRRKVRDRVRRFRARQITGVQKTWQENLGTLSEEARTQLLSKQQEYDDLMVQVNHCVHGIGYGTGKGMTGENMPLPDQVYSRVKDFISEPNRGLVQFWAPSSAADQLDPEQWEECDDLDFARYGIRTKLVNLFFREFLRHIHSWIESQNPEIDPRVAEEITTLLASLDPPKETKHIPEPPVPFVSEAERERRMQGKQLVEEYRAREVATLEKWKAEQLGQQVQQL